MGEFTKKISGGKLLRLKAGSSGEKISFVSIEGDFFAYPETIIELVEKSLIGLSVSESGDFFQKKIAFVLNENNAQIVGVGSNDIALALKEALK